MSEAPRDDPDKVVRLVPPADGARLPLRLTFYDDIKINNDTIDFVEGLLVERSAIVVYGESNSGKTFWVTDLALHVASGRTWRNKEVTQGGVVYLALEGSIGFSNRIAAWKEEFGNDTLVQFAAITETVDLLNPDIDLDRVIAAIHTANAAFGLPVKLVVIDTLSRAMAGGNENAPEDMGALVMNMDAIRHATGAAVLWIHHSGKDTAKGARGHSLLRAACDTEIEITADDTHRNARVSKQRELESGQDHSFTLKVVDLGTNNRDHPITSCVVIHDNVNTVRPKPPRLTDTAKRAMIILTELFSETGHIDIAEDSWRDAFYSRAMPGAEKEGRRKAFRRAADTLLALKIVELNNSRVWFRRPL